VRTLFVIAFRPSQSRLLHASPRFYMGAASSPFVNNLLLLGLSLSATAETHNVHSIQQECEYCCQTALYTA